MKRLIIGPQNLQIFSPSAVAGRRFFNLLERDFTAEEVNTRYVGDITYLPMADACNLYFASVIDLGSRKLARWRIADHMRRGLSKTL